ncbi:MAG TPA: M50 family metallopeptidase [Candidatus Polarisedimenticolaceae bacterium]|nr:M50 family metallopeptidase [Candidatus Polarisedimenticolaceae bacterium]
MEPRSKRSGSWSVTVGTVIGVPIRIHVTFVILLVWYGYHASRAGHDPGLAIAFLLSLFGCVVLHELGHAATGIRFGVRTREIVLYPIGGVARLENMPGGKAELLIALAGPTVNLLLAVAIELVLLSAGIVPEIPAQLTRPSQLLPYLLVVNLALFLFNLLPAFPMDGGRVLRAVLSLTGDPTRATTIATRVGQVTAVVFAVVGLLAGNPFLVVIALFVFLGATQEALASRQHAVLSGRRARDAMATRFDTLAPQDSLPHAAELLAGGLQQDFPVVDAWNRVVGLLSREPLLRGLAELGERGAVLDVMTRDVSVAAPDDDLSRVLELMRASPGAPVLVLDGERLVGLITGAKLAEVAQRFRAGAVGAPRG